MNKPLVSVIVVVLGEDGPLQAIEAVARQTYTKVELVLVDALYEQRKKEVVAAAADRFVSLRHVGTNVSPQRLAEVGFDAGLFASQGDVLLFADGNSIDRLDVGKHAEFHARPENADGELVDDYGASVSRDRAVAARGQVLNRVQGREEAPAATIPLTRDPIASAPARRKLRLAMIYGQFSSAGHGPYDVEGLAQTTGLTGSEGSFFNLARSLSERGHEVVVFCDIATQHAANKSGFDVVPIQMIERMRGLPDVHAAIAWNEPDYLQFAPAGAKRVCDQQLNDFGYCRAPGWERLVDQWVSPSLNHQQNVMKDLPGSCVVIPNSVDLDLFSGPAPARNPRRVVWCSSPDRGLHHLLSYWPLVRAQVPDAELRIFYKLRPWLHATLLHPEEVGRRARYIEAALPRLERMGVTVVDLVPSAQMARELQAAACLAYPCDPVRYTEGFGCSVLDAAAAGCLPIISKADALPSVHNYGSAIVSTPFTDRAGWAAHIVSAITGPIRSMEESKLRVHAEAHSRHAVADRWEAMLDALCA